MRCSPAARIHLFSLCLSACVSSVASEKIWSVFIFHRHGDRTIKGANPPSVLTALGYEQIYQSGQYLRSTYISPSSPKRIPGIAQDTVDNAQVHVSAPEDLVLLNSAQAFTQGLYPAIGTDVAAQTLANGTKVPGVLSGYQLIPVHLSTTDGASSENTAWLQGNTGCQNAVLSSNSYFASAQYRSTLESTRSFYDSLTPLLSNQFPNSQDRTFKNAYSIFDYLNVAQIHNSSFAGQTLLTDDTYHQIRTLADQHELGLAYNASEPVRAISGSTLAAQVLAQLSHAAGSQNATSAKTPQLDVQFGAYGTFLAFSGLTNLTTSPASSSADFSGIPDYASHMVFELLSAGNETRVPAAEELSVRFLFNNGSAAPDAGLVVHPLFGGSQETMKWLDFERALKGVAVLDQGQWCGVCGNSTGICSDSGTGGSASSSNAGDGQQSGGSVGGISPSVAGVIGALVTLALVLGTAALLLLTGFRFVRRGKKDRSTAAGDMQTVDGAKSGQV